MGSAKVAAWALLAEGVIAGGSQIGIGLSFGARGVSLTVLGLLIVVLLAVIAGAVLPALLLRPSTKSSLGVDRLD